MDVGDQKFISRNSEGRARRTFWFVFVDDEFFDEISNASSASSLTFDTTDVVELASLCMPSKLDRNQPRWLSDVVAEFATVNWPVKYGFGWALRIDFGDPSGEAGRDLEPRRNELYLGRYIRSESESWSAVSALLSISLLKLKKKD